MEESLRDRVLSAFGFVLLVFGLAALLQTSTLFHKTQEVAPPAPQVSERAFHQDVRAQVTSDVSDIPKALPTAPSNNVEGPSSSEIQKMLSDNRAAQEKMERSGYSSVLKARKVLERLVSSAPKGTKCDPPRLVALDRCICPAGSTWDGKDCVEAHGEMFFYMYRAQSDHNYIPSNVDMADLPGVMYYLHHEIVKVNATPGVRMNGITRILRFLVRMRPSQQLAQQMKTFMPFVAFDKGKCSVPGCSKLWAHYGFAVGCQKQGAGSTGFAYTAPTEPSGVWFSLPGACPALPVGNKDTACLTKYPGGRCDDLSVSPACTFSIDYAGEVLLNDLSGIDDYAKWQRVPGHAEYDPLKDRGEGTSFWNFRGSTAWCSRRMKRVQDLLKERYPSLPEELPAPQCF